MRFGRLGALALIALVAVAAVWSLESEASEAQSGESGFVETLSAGHQHVCSVTTEGAVQCWGYDNYNQLSSPAGRFTQVTAGANHSCGLTASGTVQCWGDDEYGKSSPPAGSFTQVSAGLAHSCGLTASGEVRCWGQGYGDRYGQRSPPTGRFTQVGAGFGYSCGLTVSGRIQCWGVDNYGELSPPAGSFTQVSAGLAHSCGLTASGEVRCWGWDGFGQASPPSGRFAQVSSGSRHSCGLTVSGAIQCWGDDEDGESSPPAGRFTQVSVGTNHSCGLTASGTVQCWGFDLGGHLSPPAGLRVMQGGTSQPQVEQYQLTAQVSPSGGGSVSGGGSYDAGAQATLRARANEGYEFSHWLIRETIGGDQKSRRATGNPLSLTVGGAVSATAVFERSGQRVTVSVQGRLYHVTTSRDARGRVSHAVSHASGGRVSNPVVRDKAVFTAAVKNLMSQRLITSMRRLDQRVWDYVGSSRQRQVAFVPLSRYGRNHDLWVQALPQFNEATGATAEQMDWALLMEQVLSGYWGDRSATGIEELWNNVDTALTVAKFVSPLSALAVGGEIAKAAREELAELALAEMLGYLQSEVKSAVSDTLADIASRPAEFTRSVSKATVMNVLAARDRWAQRDARYEQGGQALSYAEALAQLNDQLYIQIYGRAAGRALELSSGDQLEEYVTSRVLPAGDLYHDFQEINNLVQLAEFLKSGDFGTIRSGGLEAYYRHAYRPYAEMLSGYEHNDIASWRWYCGFLDQLGLASTSGTANIDLHYDCADVPPDQGTSGVIGPVVSASAPAPAVTVRITAQRLPNRQIEFALQPDGEERILPRIRFFPANPGHDRWLRSSSIEYGGRTLGKIAARLLSTGQVEFSFEPADGGDRILPRLRRFPAGSGTTGWLKSSAFEVP